MEKENKKNRGYLIELPNKLSSLKLYDNRCNNLGFL